MPDEISQITSPDVTNTSAYQNQDRVKSKFGLVALGVTGTIVAGLFVGTLPFLTPALRRICLPYVPATNTQIQNILQMCKGRSGRLVDLGSGDGRVVRERLTNLFSSDTWHNRKAIQLPEKYKENFEVSSEDPSSSYLLPANS